MTRDYGQFVREKTQWAAGECLADVELPSYLFDFQSYLVDWALRRGRAAIFADCGMGKTAMELAFGDEIVRQKNKPVLLLTPIAVGQQVLQEASKFGVKAKRSRNGEFTGDKCIWITNYEQLWKFSPNDFAAVICDESSILKSYSGKIRDAVIQFMKTIRYRLLASATPSPNDYTELGNSVEALGIMRRVEMLATYFVHDGGDTGKWRLKGHANDPFWGFVASFARAIRFPSDLGFSDEGFVLPSLNTQEHVLPSEPLEGMLFATTALTLDAQRTERRQTIEERCEKVAEIADGEESPFVAWCSLNQESDRLTQLIDGAVDVSGSHTDSEKESRFLDFAAGNIKALVTKPSMAGFGMNWQHCNRMSFFPSHSHEQYYQCVRRCWRFGQRRPVDVHIVTTEAESAVLANLKRKESMAVEMFAKVVAHMRDYYSGEKENYNPQQNVKVPAWL